MQMAAEAAGVSLGCVYRVRRVDAGFTERMSAAVAKADSRLDAREGGQPRVTVASDRRSQQAGRNWWTERHDALFLEHLRATGSVAAATGRRVHS